MSRRKTLEERIVERREKFRLQSNMILIMAGHIRAELDRLAQAVRKMNYMTVGALKTKVLDEIEAAKR